ncbi:MAG TPA: hypothetical protein VM287_10380, partial [Egibacteraceae bacterium]|nr:hypothetical protein [Egibacteraceae bacterium]
DTYLAARFRRLAGPRANGRSKKKAAVALAHKILVIAYHLMANDDETYKELGSDWFAKRDDPDRRCARLVSQLEALGHTVTLTSTQPAA